MITDIIAVTMKEVMPFLAPIIFCISAAKIAELFSSYVLNTFRMTGSGRRQY